MIITPGHWKEIEHTFVWRLELIMISSIIIIIRSLLYVHHCTIMIHLLFSTSQNIRHDRFSNWCFWRLFLTKLNRCWWLMLMTDVGEWCWWQFTVDKWYIIDTVYWWQAQDIGDRFCTRKKWLHYDSATNVLKLSPS